MAVKGCVIENIFAREDWNYVCPSCGEPIYWVSGHDIGMEKQCPVCGQVHEIPEYWITCSECGFDGIVTAIEVYNAAVEEVRDRDG